jgi:hypothetical protein
MIVGLSQDGQSVSIWQQEEWDDYNEYRDEQAISEIPNSECLDMLDTIGFSDTTLPSDKLDPSPRIPSLGIHFEDPALQLRFRKLLTWKINEIIEALRIISFQQLLGEFGKLVGLM